MYFVPLATLYYSGVAYANTGTVFEPNEIWDIYEAKVLKNKFELEKDEHLKVFLFVRLINISTGDVDANLLVIKNYPKLYPLRSYLISAADIVQDIIEFEILNKHLNLYVENNSSSDLIINIVATVLKSCLDK
jgi:hypothetical protein